MQRSQTNDITFKRAFVYNIVLMHTFGVEKKKNKKSPMNLRKRD